MEPGFRIYFDDFDESIVKGISRINKPRYLRSGIPLSMIDDTTWYQAGPKFQDVTSSFDCCRREEDDSEREFRNVFCIKDMVPSAQVLTMVS